MPAMASPGDLALKLMVKMRPERPAYPGFKTTPSKCTEPEDIDGSATHSEMTEPLFEIETAVNLSEEKVTSPETAFMA